MANEAVSRGRLASLAVLAAGIASPSSRVLIEAFSQTWYTSQPLQPEV